MSSPSGNHRDFSHSNNPGFDCTTGALLLPFGRESYLAAATQRYEASRVPLDQSTDRIVYRLETSNGPLTLVYSGMGGPAAANALEMIRANGGRRVVGVDSECATAAVVSRRIGLSLGALLFCTDNVTVSTSSDQRYRGLDDPRVRSAFEAALDSAVDTLTRTPSNG